MSPSNSEFSAVHGHGPLGEIEPPLRFLSYLDGWALAAAMAARPDYCGEAFVLMLDDDGYMFDLVAVACPAREILGLVEVLATSDLPLEVAAVVLFSLGAVAPAVISENDLAVWRYARHRCDSCGLDLLDWYLIGDGQVRSMAVITGGPTYW